LIVCSAVQLVDLAKNSAKEMDKFDAHLKLAEFHMEVRKDRRQHEWTVSLGLWALLAAGIVNVRSIPQRIPWWVLSFLILVFICHTLWISSNEKRNARDAHKAYVQFGKAEEELLGSSSGKPKDPPIYLTTILELLATILLSVALFIMYWTS
jgi:cbb3-type cytochrome oxidase subunit 3